MSVKLFVDDDYTNCMPVSLRQYWLLDCPAQRLSDSRASNSRNLSGTSETSEVDVPPVLDLTS